MKIFSILAVSGCMLVNTSMTQAKPIFSERFERIKQQAATGEKRSQYKLGLAYLRGNDIKTDISEAIYWFEKSSRQGYSKASHKLGMIYYFNKSGKVNHQKAYRWFMRAAKNNHAESQYYIGKLYFEGKGVKRNYERALFWLKKAEALDFLAATRDINHIRSLIMKDAKQKSVPGIATTVASRPAKTRRAAEPVKPVPFISPVAAVKTRRVASTQSKLGVGGPLHLAPKNVAPVRPEPIAKKIVKTSEILLSGFWLLGGKPAEEMPSALNKCTFRSDIMTCMSRRLNKQTKVAQVSYKVQARFLNFRPNGTFDVKFRKKFIFVLPLDADDPNPNANIPGTGWQKDVKNMKCQVVSKARISCKSLNGNIVKSFHR